jgi:hypothetical protein
MAITVNEVVNFILTCSQDDRHKINECLKLSYKFAQVDARNNFHRFDFVEFTTKHGDVVQGQIKKINRTNIDLTSTEGKQWRVSPSLLRKCAAPGEQPIVRTQSLRVTPSETHPRSW